MQAGGGLAAGEQQQAMATPGAEDYTNLQRVKVYRLNDSGHWDDKGTGHVSCEYMEVRARLLTSCPVLYCTNPPLFGGVVHHDPHRLTSDRTEDGGVKSLIMRSREEAFGLHFF